MTEKPAINKSSTKILDSLLILILLAAVPLLFTQAPEVQRHRLLPYVWNMGHILIFFIATWLFLKLPGLQRRMRFWPLFLGINIAVLFVGIGIELIQEVRGRSFSFQDIFKNGIGASAALLIHPTIRPFRAGMLYFSRGLLLVAFLIACWPLGKNTIDWLYARNSFPVLADFETPFEMERWRRGNDKEIIEEFDNRLMINEFLNTRHSTLTFANFQPDWRNQHCLKLRIENRSEDNVALRLRISDRQHNLNNRAHADRFNHSLALVPGWNDVMIPVDEILNAPDGRRTRLSEVDEITFFTSRLKQPVVLGFDDIELMPPGMSCKR